MENDDGTLPETEKDALQRMVLMDILANSSQETGDEKVLEGEHDSGEEHNDFNETLKQITEECSPVSLRHHQALVRQGLVKRFKENARMQD